MVIGAGILMLAIAVFVVAYPLFQGAAVPSRLTGASSDEDLAELLIRRDATYVALKELDLDHGMGKLSPVDYQALRDEYRAEAVVILQELDSRQAGARVRVAEKRAMEREIEQEVEREIAARRRQRRRQRRGPARCPGCGVDIQPGDRFCRRCGAALRGEQA